jgi:hypothetical protein
MRPEVNAIEFGLLLFVSVFDLQCVEGVCNGVSVGRNGDLYVRGRSGSDECTRVR